MAKRDRLSEDDLRRVVSLQIDDATNYSSDDREKDREWALKFFDGQVDFDPINEHSSKVVSRDVADTHGLILPGLLRIFFGSSRIVDYEPTRQQHEEYAEMASDLVNYVVMRECDGYRHFRNAMADGLLLGNGIVKHWWDETPEYTTDEFTGLTQEGMQITLSDADIEEVFDEEEYVDPDYTPPSQDEIVAMAQQNGIPVEALTDEVMAQIVPPPPMLYDFKIKRVVSTGRLRFAALPPEEFLIERSATELDEDVRFCAHVQRKTRSELIKAGYDRSKVDELPLSDDDDEEDEARDSGRWSLGDDAPDHATEHVDVYECYVLVDQDGDGIAERRRVVVAGHAGKRTVLANEEWGDDLPFSDIVPDPVPHRWRGRGLFEEMGDIQRINTALMRGALDNMYRVLVPQTYAWADGVDNPDELVNPTPGGIIWLNNRTQQVPQARQTDYYVPQILPMIEYMNSVGEKRTGVSMRSQAMDLDALQNQSATAVNAAQSAAYSKVEEYARNTAEFGGMKRIFGCLLKLLTKHQDRPKTIRLRGKLVEVDPRSWDSDMDVTINTGLGTGSRERDTALMSAIVSKQESILQTAGMDNPIVSLDQYGKALQKLAESGGAKSPEQFFKAPSAEELQQMAQEQAQQPQPPDPEMVKEQHRHALELQKAQAEIQIDQQKMEAKAQADAEKRQFDAQADREKMELDAQLRREESAAKVQATREEAAAKLELLREETSARIQIERDKMQLHHESRLAEMQAEENIRLAQLARGNPQSSNIPRPE